MRCYLVLIATFTLHWFSTAYASTHETLTVYTNATFTSPWGPGAEIKKAFEQQCKCTVNFVGISYGTTILPRLQLEGDRSKADVVLGLDAVMTSIAKETGLFMPHHVNMSPLSIPIEWTDELFVPFIYGYHAFIYDRNRFLRPPASMQELIDAKDVSIIIQDPRSSSVGFGLLLWMKAIYGDQAAAMWHKIYPRIVTITKGWNDAYHLFAKGEADMIFGYTNIPLYYVNTEAEQARYKAARFKEGHLMHMEVAGILKHTKHPELAKMFMQFTLTQAFQEAIAKAGYMYPVVRLDHGIPASYHPSLTPQVFHPLIVNDHEVLHHRSEWIEEWLLAMHN